MRAEIMCIRIDLIQRKKLNEQSASKSHSFTLHAHFQQQSTIQGFAYIMYKVVDEENSK